MVTAVGVKKLWYTDPSKVTADLTGAALATIIKDSANTKSIKNVHGGTWSIDESEPSTTPYKNELTDATYRESREMGEVTMSFSIGQYDYMTKADFMGGTATATSWKRARGVTNIHKCIIALTDDDQYCVFPKASVVARNANTDDAVAIGVVATALEPDNDVVSAEYWFDISEVDTSAASVSSSGSKL